ncbi:hypothetical protein CLOM_g3140 [Closterium sp. NIES-68]|nr:hypothetical protein CLOM_g22275 [Closterium sp. NIES-68]GJP43708.1 hypothetical protein CLOM_g3140 [Closterium sp. NIES-68]GJP82939.1 hypothetical protein CLOP_g13158 [Closterium sp. NIES-67]
MPHSSDAIGSPSRSQSSSLAVKPWSAEEDAVLLRHALHCGTRQWGMLGRRGQLKRNNKSCCNRYIFLRRKFVQRFQEILLREHLGGSAFSRRIALEAHSQLLLRRDGQQQQYWQQQQQQQQQHPEQQAGVGSLGSPPSPGLTFGGLSFDQCRRVFLSPNAHRPTAQASLATAFCTAAASSDGAALSTAAAAASSAAVFSVASFPDPALVSSAGSFNAAFPNASAACKLPMKRAREDYGGLLADPSLSGLAGSGWASRTLHHSQSLEDLFLQQGGERSEVQAALWARVVSESALPDDVLLGFSSEDPGVSVPFAALPAPLPAPFSAQPPQAAALPAPLPAPFSAQPPQAAALPAPLPAPFSAQPPQAAALPAPLPAPFSAQPPQAAALPAPLPAPFSVQPPQAAALPKPLPTQLAAPTGSVPRGICSCLGGTPSFENGCAGQEMPAFMGACTTVPKIDPQFLNTHVANLCMPAPASYLPTEATEASEASEPQGRPLAGCLLEPALPERALEQGGMREWGQKGGQARRHQHPVGQGRVSLPQRRHQQQLNDHQRLELQGIPSLLEPYPQTLPEPLHLEQALALAPSQAWEQASALAPSQALEQALALAPSQALEQALALAPSQALEQALALAPSQALEQALSLAPSQAWEQASALAPSEALEQALALAPSEALEQALALPSSQALEQALALAPSQALEQAFALPSSQALEQALALPSSQALEQALALPSSQALEQALALAPSQALEQAFALAPSLALGATNSNPLGSLYMPSTPSGSHMHASR